MIVTTIKFETTIRIVGESVEANLARINDNDMHDAVTRAENNIKWAIVNKPSNRMGIDNTVEVIGTTRVMSHDKIHKCTDSHPINPDRFKICSIDGECFDWENNHWAYDTNIGSNESRIYSSRTAMGK